MFKTYQLAIVAVILPATAWAHAGGWIKQSGDLLVIPAVGTQSEPPANQALPPVPGLERLSLPRPTVELFDRPRVETRFLPAGRVRMTLIARYRATVLVIGMRAYTDEASSFAPVDLALGWGMAGHPDFDYCVRFIQKQRWVFRGVRSSCPLSPEYVEAHTANTHIVPADQKVAKAILSLRRRQWVRIDGYLIDLEFKKGGRKIQWHTSRSLDDRGNGSCELMLVERLSFNNSLVVQKYPG